MRFILLAATLTLALTATDCLAKPSEKSRRSILRLAQLGGSPQRRRRLDPMGLGDTASQQR